MSEQSLDPAEFAERLDAAFGSEPGHAGIQADLARGRRRLRRHRAGNALASLAAVASVAAVVSVLPGGGTGATTGPASTVTLSVQDIVDRCMQDENVLAHAVDNEAPYDSMRIMGEPRLMTSAVTATRGEATLLSRDGTRWAECQWANSPDANVKDARAVYPMAVTFPERRVDGVDAYAPHDEADPRLAATQTLPVPQFEVTCTVEQQEETAAWYREAAACATYTLTWNDRRPAVVGHVGLTAPDGKELDADVRDGFVSLAYTGRMTPELAAQVARGEMPQAQRITFYTADGDLLVDDRDPGRTPQDGSLSIANFPSLAWWLTNDPG